MYKKGHTGMIKVKRATEEKPGTLEIKVRIGGHGANTGNVKDLKQLSGESTLSEPFMFRRIAGVAAKHLAFPVGTSRLCLWGSDSSEADATLLQLLQRAT